MIHKKYPFVRQRENKDCGVACLSMIIKYYNGCISEDTLYDMTNTDKKGTSAYNLIKTANSIGFKSEGIRCNIEQLKDISFPCIAHVLLDEKYGHYVVIYEIDWKKKEIYIGDPARKKLRMSIQEFKRIFTEIIITFVHQKPLPLYKNQITLKKYLKNLLITYKKEWLKIWITSILALLISIIVSFSMIVMLQGIYINSYKWISYTILIFIFLSIIKSVITYIQEKMIYRVQHKINIHLMAQAIKNIIFLPYQFYCNRSTGEIVSRLQDLEKVGYGISQIIILLCMDFMMSLVSGIILFVLNNSLFKWLIIWIIIYILIASFFRKVIQDKISILKQTSSSMYNDLIEVIKGFETIKGLQLEDNQVHDVSKKYIDYDYKLLELENIENKQKAWKNIVSDIGYIFICGLSCIQVIRGNIEISHVLAYQTLITYFLLPIEHILNMNTSICDMEKSLQRTIEILYSEEEKQKLNCKKIKTIELNNLSYEKNNTIINNICLKIHKNEKIILMGKSGSGKSTLLKIIRGYYPISNGKVYINGIDINSYTKDSIGKRITYISQNEILFTNTIYNNITLNRNYNEDDIVKQIKINHIDQITKNKMMGLQDIIEEDGYNLSGGERQRIILARSLLKTSDVILIDEGFSQMDSNLERNILKNLFKLYSHKIIVVVSHRNDNMDLFDTYIELENGKIHKYLQKSKG